MFRLYNVYADAVALHIDIGNCLNGCIYCYASCKNLKKTTVRQIQGAINREDQESLFSFYVKNRYPVCICNHSDIFNSDNLNKEVIKILRELGFPFYWMTKGTDDKNKLDWFFKIADPKKDIIYYTITNFANGSIIEPNVHNKKLKFLHEIRKAGFHIEIGFNPVLKDYINENEIINFMETYKNDIIGYHIHPVHLSTDNKKTNLKSLQFTNKFFNYISENSHKMYSKIKGLTHLNGLGIAERAFFNKPMIISDDIEEICKIRFNDSLPGAKKIMKSEKVELSEILCGKTSFDQFTELKKDILYHFKDCIVDKNEIKAPYKTGSYFHANLPKKMKYIDYLRILWDNPNMLSPINYARVNGEEQDGNMYYWYRHQPFFEVRNIC